jgi:plasmid stability protein
MTQPEVAMAMHDFARQAADLVSTGDKSGSRSLNELVALASRQVPACSGATAALWRDGEPVEVTASHPDVSDLLDAELRSGRGPVLDALATGQPAHCPDTLDDTTWPEFAHAALCRGVRCSVTLVHQPEAAAITLSLFSVRPRALDPDRLPLAELLVAAGGAVMGNVSQYGEARRTALQLRDAAHSRAVVDQAKGILMQAFGCSADEALERMRDISQRRSMKVTEVAKTIIESRQAKAG